MLGGVNITDTTRSHAAEMLGPDRLISPGWPAPGHGHDAGEHEHAGGNPADQLEGQAFGQPFAQQHGRHRWPASCRPLCRARPTPARRSVPPAPRWRAGSCRPSPAMKKAMAVVTKAPAGCSSEGASLSSRVSGLSVHRPNTTNTMPTIHGSQWVGMYCATHTPTEPAEGVG